MPEPLCLIENTNGRLLVNPKALKILSAIQQPVVVVAIVGLYRTGKSYLMNKLAGKNKGFSVGSTVQSHTKGIWMWCVPHPEKPNHILVLLDTEGLGDIEKARNKDSFFFFFAVRGPLTVVASPVAERRLRTRRPSGHGSRAQPLRGMWDPPGQGHEPVSPASAGGLSTTAPPGKPRIPFQSTSSSPNILYTGRFLFVLLLDQSIPFIPLSIFNSQSLETRSEKNICISQNHNWEAVLTWR
uniref:GB1/RHD3-type G domain-containing protein n=1 Tax=Monodon monoceros TaxID=40151 RepID=A0A8C6AXS4_MONMO